MNSPSRKLNLVHSPAIKLAVYYATFFGLLCAALFWLANSTLTQTIHRKQLKAVKNKALEYRAWFLKGDIQQLESRMGEQSLQAGDVLFVHISGTDFQYLNFTNSSYDEWPSQDLANLEGFVQGHNIPLGGKKWTVVSVPVGETGLILKAGKNSQAMSEILHDFRQTTSLLLLPGGLIAIIAGTLLAYRFLAPTRELITTMQGILESGDLSKRTTTGAKNNELNAMSELFNQMQDKNEKLIQAMQESLDQIAHDLRSPISRIRITNEQALLLINPKLSDYKLAIESSTEEVDYIQSLLTVLMDLAEAKSGALILNKENLNPHTLLHDVVELYELVAEAKNIQLKIANFPDNPKPNNHHLSVKADRTRILQALANLLDNAIKYSPSNTTITLHAEPIKRGGVAISIEDQGSGISKEDLPYVWDRLFRADRNRTETGMGLGLSLVKALVKSHGGSVKVHSHLNQGSRFTIKLP